MRFDTSPVHVYQQVVLLTATLALVGTGCKFREPDPSADIYLGGVAPVPVREARDLVKQGARKQTSPKLASLAAAAPPAVGYHVIGDKGALLFRPPGDMVRTTPEGGMHAWVGGKCLVAQTRVFFPCSDTERGVVGAERLAARLLYGRGLDDVAVADTPAGIRVTAPDGPTLEATIGDRGITDIRRGGTPVFADVLGGAQPQALQRGAIEAALQPPESGVASRAQRPSYSLVCVPHTGALTAIGPSVRSANDTVANAQLTTIASVGVLVRQVAGARKVCVAVTTPAAGTEAAPSHPVWRVWHRGDYAGLSARRVEGDAGARAAGHIPTGDWTITLYQDPSAVDVSTLVSHIDLHLQR